MKAEVWKYSTEISMKIYSSHVILLYDNENYNILRYTCTSVACYCTIVLPSFYTIHVHENDMYVLVVSFMQKYIGEQINIRL